MLRIIFVFFMLTAFVQANSQSLSVSTNYTDQRTFQLSIEQESALILRLQIDNPTGQQLRLQMLHDVWGTVVDTSFACERFSRRYNMTNAENGIYRVIVRHGKNKIVKEIVLKDLTSRELQIENK